MLSVKALTTEELIDKLTKSGGKLPPSEFLITITEPNSQKIISTRKQLLSLEFTEESLDTKTTSTLLRFIFHDVSGEVDLFFDKDFILYVHAFQNSIAHDIVEYIYLYLSEGLLGDSVVFWNSYYSFLKGCGTIIAKMQAVENIHTAFGIEY